MIRTLSAKAANGSAEVRWDGRDMNRRKLSSGVYVTRVMAGETMREVKLILAKS